MKKMYISLNALMSRWYKLICVDVFALMNYIDAYLVVCFVVDLYICVDIFLYAICKHVVLFIDLEEIKIYIYMFSFQLEILYK